MNNEQPVKEGRTIEDDDSLEDADEEIIELLDMKDGEEEEEVVVRGISNNISAEAWDNEQQPLEETT